MPIQIFSTAKTFEPWPQQNAVRSWNRIGPVRMYDAITLAKEGIEVSPSGAPVLKQLFRYGSRYTYSGIACYVNADIILTSLFERAVEAVNQHFSKGYFLMVGRRTNWVRPEPLDFDDPAWEMTLCDKLSGCSTLFNAATDYFVFHSSTFDFSDWPDLYQGRYYWDWWICWHAMQTGIPVVDATEAALVVHQNHPVGHRSWDEDGKHNMRLTRESEASGGDLDSVPFYLTRDFEVKKR